MTKPHSSAKVLIDNFNFMAVPVHFLADVKNIPPMPVIPLSGYSVIKGTFIESTSLKHALMRLPHGSQYFPRAVKARRAPHARRFHGFSQARRPVLTNAQFALHGGK